ncbi:MAG: TylF/MycF/NovP-related O-methyltransferase [Crocosphaera sp.]
MINKTFNYFQQTILKLYLPSIIKLVKSKSLTYLDDKALYDLFKQVKIIENKNKDGILIEAGCALGGSAVVITVAKSRERPLFVYDVFEMIPPPSEKDDMDVKKRYEVIKTGKSQGIAGNKYYGYEENLIAKVRENFDQCGVPIEENNVHLIQGLFQDTLQVNQPVALAHIDGDWYESVMTCLQQIEPHLIEKGVLIIDDYYSWSGCRKAVDEYFKDKQNMYKFVKKSRLHIVRK